MFNAIMISLKCGLPLVRGDGGVSVTLDMTWLRATLTHAAGRAGYPCWWLADDLVAGISLYLSDNYSGNVIDLSKLESVVKSLLCDVGYSEVARNFHTMLPHRHASLARLL